MKCLLCSDDAVDVGPVLLREIAGALWPKVVARELAGPRWCYPHLRERVMDVVVREYRANERRQNRKPWGGRKG